MFMDEGHFTRERFFYQLNTQMWIWKTPMVHVHVQHNSVSRLMLESLFLEAASFGCIFCPFAFTVVHTRFFLQQVLLEVLDTTRSLIFAPLHMVLAWGSSCTLHEWCQVTLRNLCTIVDRSWCLGSFSCQIARPIIHGILVLGCRVFKEKSTFIQFKPCHSNTMMQHSRNFPESKAFGVAIKLAGWLPVVISNKKTVFSTNRQTKFIITFKLCWKKWSKASPAATNG